MSIALLLLLAYAGTLIVHEAGHVAVAAALRLPWRPVLTWRGLLSVRIGRDGVDLTRRQVVLTAAGGPLANVLLCIAAWRIGQGLVVLVGLDFLLFNVLPFRHSDGWRMLRPGRAIARAKAAETKRLALVAPPAIPCDEMAAARAAKRPTQGQPDLDASAVATAA